jgi:thioredoxin reductase
MSEHDVLIIGGGAAGRSAALVLSRARRRVLVVDAGEPRNAPAAHVQGYLSRDGLPPGELLGLGRSEVEHYGGRVVSGTVTDLRFTAAGQLMADLADGSRLSARRVLVATGLQDVLPDIAGGDQRFGRDVLHCPYCHGYEVRDRRLGVLGGGPDSLHQVQLVRQWSRDVVFFTAGTVLTADHREQLVARAIGVVDGDVTRLLVQDDRLTGVEVDGVRVVHRDAVFRSPRFVPNTGLLARLGCDQDQNGWIVHDGGRTSVAGVWVAGNASNARAQVITPPARLRDGHRPARRPRRGGHARRRHRLPPRHARLTPPDP